MDGARFASPYVLLLLLAVPALAWYARGARGVPASVLVGALGAAAGARRTWRVRAERLLPALRLLAVALLIVALARPQRGEASSRTRGEGIDIVLGFDISSSMTQPFARGKTRMQAAQDVLSQFVAARTDDRVGLVVFQGASLTLSPLTTDYRAIAQELQDAGRINLEDGTAIGVAIGQSVNVLRGSNAASRIVILLTDGENNGKAIEPLAAARIAERLGVRVYTVGVVSRGTNPGFSRLNVDEQSLREIADVTGGTYNRAEDPNALAEIYANIDRLERSRFEDERFTRYDEIAPMVLAAAAVMLTLEMVLRYGVLRRAV
ncbi:MAG: VWA domain-containing protein [Chloroflexota bacterium]